MPQGGKHSLHDSRPVMRSIKNAGPDAMAVHAPVLVLTTLPHLPLPCSRRHGSSEGHECAAGGGCVRVRPALLPAERAAPAQRSAARRQPHTTRYRRTDGR